MARRGDGFTLLELLVVLAVVAIASATALRVGRPSGAHQAASAAQALMAWSRLGALRSGSGAWLRATAQGLEVRSASGASGACAGGSLLRRVRWSDFGSVRVEQPLRSGILWRSDGLTLSCAGGGVISGRLLLTDGRSRFAVVVSSLGRVRVARVP